MKKNGGKPRSGKFSEIRHLQERNASERHHEVRDTLDEFTQRREEQELEEDSEVRVHRNHYAQLVAKFRNHANTYSSVGLFVETMMREINIKEDASTRAAAATWALNLLATQPSQTALREVIAALLPAVYCQYDAQKLPYASASIQVQLKDPQTISWNPYFTHTMYVDQVDVDKGNVTKLADSMQRIIVANDRRRDFIIRFVEDNIMQKKKTIFREWRSHVRRNKILNMIHEKRNQKHQAEVDRYQLQTAFYQWKVQLETSRSAFLTERLHEAAAQLENAKNQFQLQCYRADRLIQTTKEAKDELDRALTLNAGLEKMVANLQEELVRREREYQQKLSDSVQDACKLAKDYRGMVKNMYEMMPPPASYLMDAPNFTEEIDDEEFNLLLGFGDSEDRVSFSDVLLQWCNGILYNQASDKEQFAPIRNFGSDFSSGEVMYELFKIVFPAAAVVLPPDCDREFRINRLKEMSQKCQLCYILDLNDFTKNNEDRVALAVAELFRHYIGKRHKDAALKASQLMSNNPEHNYEHTEAEGEEDQVEVKDETDFKKYVAECEHYLKEVKAKLLPQIDYERQLAEHDNSVLQGEAHVLSQRLQGTPLPHIGNWASRYFWRVNPKSLTTLKEVVAPNMDAQLWTQLLQGPLKQKLLENAETTSRLFYTYAGQGNKTIYETSFWRFVDTHAIVNASFTRETMAAIFDMVASPQLGNLLKTQGKTAEEARLLAQAARQEMDLRQISNTQFVEILVRTGAVYYGTSFGLAEGVDRFLRSLSSTANLIVSHPLLLAFWEAEVQEVFRFFGDDLARVFFFYTKKQESSKLAKERALAMKDGGRFGSVLSNNMFVEVLRDSEYLAENNSYIKIYTADCPPRMFITASQVEQLLLSLQDAYENVVRPGELNFTVFIDALCVLSNYWCPDLLVYTSRKLAAFLSDMITQLITRYSGSTLILGEPPLIPLKGEKKVTFF